jgi:hypothetical protein
VRPRLQQAVRRSRGRETAGRKYLYAPLRRLDFLTSVLRLLVIYRSMDLMRDWRWTRNEKSLARPMTTDLAPVSGLTREFRGLQQLGHFEQKLAALSLACSPLRTSGDDVRV